MKKLSFFFVGNFAVSGSVGLNLSADSKSNLRYLPSNTRRALFRRTAKKIFATIALCTIVGSAANGQAIKISPTGDVQVSKGLSVYGGFGVGEDVWLNKNLNVFGSADVNGGLSVGSSLAIFGPTTYNGNQTYMHIGWLAYPYDEFTIYSDGLNLSFGKYGNWANSVYAYTINYQTLLQPSDMRLKENIKPCMPLLSKLKKVQSYNYNYTDEYFKNFTSAQKQKAQRTEYGFLAQEMQTIFPELVHESDSGILSINYVGMIPILTAAINELQKGTDTRDSVITALIQKVEYLENALTACCSGKTQKSLQPFELTSSTDANTEELKVYQNVPNPFNENTVIRCYIPESFRKVELCVYDMQGGLLKCFAISERGATSVQIQAGQLAAGVYTYLLIGDDKTSDAKQMILTK